MGIAPLYGIIGLTKQINYQKEQLPTMSISYQAENEKTSPKIFKATFDNNTASDNLAFSYVESFKQTIGFLNILRNRLTYLKSSNSTFSTVDIIDYMADALILGYSRFYHMDILRGDKAYARIKDRKLPSEKVCRDLIRELALQMPEEAAKALRLVSKDILSQMAELGTARDVFLDIDDTVCTIYGNQEGAEVGYNPRYKGRASFKEKLAVISGTRELVNLTLEGGKHNIQNGLIDFILSSHALLPESWHLAGVRMDSGTYSDPVLTFLESRQLKYVIKCKKYEHIRWIIQTVIAHEHLSPWQDIDKVFSVNEIYAPLPNYETLRRFVVVRKNVPVTDQLPLEGALFQYEYYVIVANMECLTPEEIFHDYNQRCSIETKIDELKEGFAFDNNSRRNQTCNELFLLVKMIAYNLHNWFRLSLLPEDLKNCEITTIRRKLYRVPGNLAGIHPRYIHIRFPNLSRLKKTIQHIIRALKSLMFRKRKLVVC